MDMAAEVASFFAHLPRFIEAARGIHGTCRFDVDDAGSWVVEVDAGTVRLRPLDVPVDCTFGCDTADFLAIVSGRQNMLTAVMQGRLSIDGDITLAQRLHALVRAERPGDQPPSGARP